MTLSMRRVVLFTKNMQGMTAFYRDVLGLKLRKEEKGWSEFDANGCVIALHNGTSSVGRRPPPAQDRLLGGRHRRRARGIDQPWRQDVEDRGRRRPRALRGQGSRRQSVLDLRSRRA